jgi:acid phosphatase family membrane protein YuiD
MLQGLTRNEHFRIALLAMILAQVLKMLTFFIKHRRINFRVLVQASGMPSSHTSMVLALATSVGYLEGWDSVTFAIALVFGLIVMYDAAGVRRAAGKQARVLNMIMEDMFHKKKIDELRLKELLGHTPLEVIFGGLLGIFTAFIYHLVFRV